MIKKLLLMFMSFIVFLHAENNDINSIDRAFQVLVYEVGMSLSTKSNIEDFTTAKTILLQVEQEVETFSDVVNLFLEIDPEVQEHNITSFEQLIDYEYQHSNRVVNACIVWLQAYQNVFKVFNQIHGDQASFDLWEQDIDIIMNIDDNQKLVDLLYEQLWQAGYQAIIAQQDLEQAIKDAK